MAPVETHTSYRDTSSEPAFGQPKTEAIQKGRLGTIRSDDTSNSQLVL
jgi:hypothetical protein